MSCFSLQPLLDFCRLSAAIAAILLLCDCRRQTAKPSSTPHRYGNRNTVASGDFDSHSYANSFALAVTVDKTKSVSNSFSFSPC